MSVHSTTGARVRQGKHISQRHIDQLQPDQKIWGDRSPDFCVRCKVRSKTFGLQIRIRGEQRWITLGRWDVLTPDEARQKARVLLGRLAIGDDIATERERFKAFPTAVPGMVLCRVATGSYSDSAS